jgi:hypothetical protein
VQGTAKAVCTSISAVPSPLQDLMWDAGLTVAGSLPSLVALQMHCAAAAVEQFQLGNIPKVVHDHQGLSACRVATDRRAAGGNGNGSVVKCASFVHKLRHLSPYRQHCLGLVLQFYTGNACDLYVQHGVSAYTVTGALTLEAGLSVTGSIFDGVVCSGKVQ